MKKYSAIAFLILILLSCQQSEFEFSCDPLIFSGALSFNFYASKKTNSMDFSISMLASTAQASPEGCLNNPNQNKGWCREDVSGGDWYCVIPEYGSTWYDCVSEL